MNDLTARDVEYGHDGTRMLGALRAPAGVRGAPGVLLLHDAFGLSDDMLAIAERLAGVGFAVLAADVWGERARPRTQDEIGALIGAMVADRPRWAARVAAAHAAAAEQPEIDDDAIVALGYCFGGSSALEHLRTGGAVRGVVSVHPGLDLLDADAGWGACDPTARVLLCTGDQDPMATAAQRDSLQRAMTGAGLDWETDLYSGTRHAFTSPHARFSPTPEAVAYHPRNAERAWDATTRFLRELARDLSPAVVG
ncbi:dienelactone hydrolase family protein [Isoptericola sp. NPDC056618]|uniref:dienelactone hydrolase family protein n=1 Tax=Isoptericola sp. NPDC056618 TaxID=3345878 RepID=UPI0036A0A0C0